MTDFEQRSISFLFEKIDEVGANLVANTYQNLVSQYMPAFLMLTAIYLGLVFIKMMRGHYDANDFVVLILRTMMILTLVLNYHYFYMFFYDVFTNTPLEICKAITINGGHIETTSIKSSLDNFLREGEAAVTHIFSLGSWSNPTYMLFGAVLFILVGLTAAFAAGMIVLAKCASTILLALSPIFIFFALYDSTKGLFDSYIRQLITYALIPVMTSAILMMLMSVSNSAIMSLKSHQQYNFISIIPLGLMCIIQMFLLLQIKGKCAALAGGFCLPTVISAFRNSKSEFASVGQRFSRAAGASYRHATTASKVGRQAGQALVQRMSRFNK